MKIIKAGVALLAVLTLSTQALEAQQRGRRGRGPAFGQLGAEQILRARERLNLTEAQISDLEELRKETLAARRTQMGATMELRSRAQAGDTAAFAELRTLSRTQREAAQARRDEYRNRINGILTEEQQGQLPSVGRRSMARGRGFQGRSPRGFRGPGTRGVRPGRGFRGGAPEWNRGGRGFGPRSRPQRFRRGPRRPADAESDVK